MIQLLLHLIGDFVIQNDWMALNKKKVSWAGELACQLHCVTYALPFLIIGSWWAVLAIYITHYIFDRTKVLSWVLAYRNGIRDIENFGVGHQRPFAISIWLNIFFDNTIHLVCNYLALMFL